MLENIWYINQQEKYWLAALLHNLQCARANSSEYQFRNQSGWYELNPVSKY